MFQVAESASAREHTQTIEKSQLRHFDSKLSVLEAGKDHIEISDNSHRRADGLKKSKNECCDSYCYFLSITLLFMNLKFLLGLLKKMRAVTHCRYFFHFINQVCAFTYVCFSIE